MKQQVIRNYGLSAYSTNKYISTNTIPIHMSVNANVNKNVSDHQKFICQIQKVQMAREGLIKSVLKQKMQEKKKLQSYLHKKMIIPRAMKQNYSDHQPLNVKALKLCFQPSDSSARINSSQQKAKEKQLRKQIKRRNLKNQNNKWKFDISYKNIHCKYFKKKSDHNSNNDNKLMRQQINTINSNEIVRHYKTASSVNRRIKPQSVHCQFQTGIKSDMISKWKLGSPSSKGITQQEFNGACFSKDQIMTAKYFLLPSY